MEKLKEQYVKEVIPALMKKFQYKSIMQVPKLENINQLCKFQNLKKLL